MSDEPFVSYAPNGEDVVLWRALGGIQDGGYVEVRDEATPPVGRVLDDAGWRAETVIVADALTSSLDALLAERGVDPAAVHLLRVDAGGAEADVLGGVDLDRWRPWVLVVRSDGVGNPWEGAVTAAGYTRCLYDGVSTFYVHADHRDRLGGPLSYPACSRDGYVLAREVDLAAERDELLGQVIHWRTTAFGTWARAVQDTRQKGVQAQYLRAARLKVKELQQRVQRLRGRVAETEARLAEIEGSTSWRVTGPLRGATGSARRISRRGR